MLDKEYVSSKNLSQFVNTNEGLLRESTPAGIVLEFPGLGGGSCLGGNYVNEKYETPYAKQLADENILLVYCCPGPWSWMNRGAVRYTELVCDALFEKFGLSETTPIAATGGSMGGLGALMWSVNTRHRVTACAAACPCCDALEGFFARPEFGRTFLDAILAYDEPIEDALRSISPLCQIDRMKDIPYYLTADGEDECFPIEGIDAFVASTRARGLSVDYRRMPGLRHGEFTAEAREDLTKFVIQGVLHPVV